MNPQDHSIPTIKRIITFLTMLGIVFLLVSLGGTGCEENNSATSGASGTTSLTGNVQSFTGSGVSFFPQQVPRRTLLAVISDMLVPSAHAAVGGVTVTVLSTGAEVVTDASGRFTVAGVPAGTQEIMFTLGAQSAILVLNVPENTTIVLQDITITQTSVNVGAILIEEVVAVAGDASAGNSTVQGDGVVSIGDEDEDDENDEDDEDDVEVEDD